MCNGTQLRVVVASPLQKSDFIMTLAVELCSADKLKKRRYSITKEKVLKYVSKCYTGVHIAHYSALIFVPVSIFWEDVQLFLYACAFISKEQESITKQPYVSVLLEADVKVGLNVQEIYCEKQRGTSRSRQEGSVPITVQVYTCKRRGRGRRTGQEEFQTIAQF